MPHQLAALERLDGKRAFALFMEQGTGKTWAFLADAERYWRRGKIDGLLVMAPNGVHTNWVRREIPTHLECAHSAVAFRSGAGKAEAAAMAKILRPGAGWNSADGERAPLRILTMNYEALNGEAARKFALDFLQSGRMMMVCDESQKIKNPDAAVTKRLLGLRVHAVARRIGSGTPMDKPQDIFSQFEFLHPGMLGTTSYRAFVAEYAVLANAETPRTADDWSFKRQVDANPRMRHSQRIARDDATGLPMYRNLDRLHSLVAAQSFRVLKADCLGLPPKVYQSVYFELTPKQQRAYQLMEQELRIELEDGSVTPVHALASLTKLQQITSGYVIVPGEAEPTYIGEDNPRIAAVGAYIADNVVGKVIVWARFREEIRALAARLRADGRRVAEYHGDVSAGDREAAIDGLQSGDIDTFIGAQKAGGTGLTLTAAQTTIYCSNEHSAIVRNQSEDRNHRKGTSGTVVYVDVVAEGTIDESITRAHQWKTNLAQTILGDRGIDLRAAF